MIYQTKEIKERKSMMIYLYFFKRMQIHMKQRRVFIYITKVTIITCIK